MRCIDLYIEEIISWYFIFVPVQYKWLWILCRDATRHVRRRDSQLMRQKRKVRVNMYCENAQNGSYCRSVCSLTGLVLCTCTHCGSVLLACNVYGMSCELKSAYHLSEQTGLDDLWIKVRVFPKSANQLNKMMLNICNWIYCYCFKLLRDQKVENLANGKEISTIPFRTEKEEINFPDMFWKIIAAPFYFLP